MSIKIKFKCESYLILQTDICECRVAGSFSRIWFSKIGKIRIFKLKLFSFIFERISTRSWRVSVTEIVISALWTWMMSNLRSELDRRKCFCSKVHDIRRFANFWKFLPYTEYIMGFKTGFIQGVVMQIEYRIEQNLESIEISNDL